jgi:hypothetical protein
MAGIASSTIPLSYAWSARYAEGRISFPVSPSAEIYAQFEHVSGFASSSGGTVGLDRLEVLNSIIERLESMQSQSLAAKEAPSSLSPARVDALIKQYGDELHRAAAAPAKPYVAKPAATPGMIFTLAA